MGTIFLGSEAVSRQELSFNQLRRSFSAICPNVYMPRVGERTLYRNTVGAWLWSRRRAVITGRAAAALHGASWVDADVAIELLWNNNHPPTGIVTRNERIGDQEVVKLCDMMVASVPRTAFDLGRHLPRAQAVLHLDALARATGLTATDILPLAELYKGARGLRRLREAVDLMDAGAASPKETWLRLVLTDAGFPRPQTQIPVSDDAGYPFAFLDMGWQDMMIAVEYDGDQHRRDRAQYAWDVKRLRRLSRAGWIHVKVIAEDRPYEIVQRVRRAWQRRDAEASATKRNA